jgi:hypothetical protein
MSSDYKDPEFVMCNDPESSGSRPICVSRDSCGLFFWKYKILNMKWKESLNFYIYLN